MEYVNEDPLFNQIYGYLVGTFVNKEVKIVGALANMIEVFYPGYGYVRIFVTNGKWFIGVREAHKYKLDVTRYNTRVSCTTRIVMNHKVHNNLRTNLLMIKSLVEEYERRLEALVVDDQVSDDSNDFNKVNGNAPHDEVVIRNYINDHYNNLGEMKISVVSVDEDSTGTDILITLELSDNNENYKMFLIETMGRMSTMYPINSKVSCAVHEPTGELNSIGLDKSLDIIIGESIERFKKSLE